jgi:hypothetical protein
MCFAIKILTQRLEEIISDQIKHSMKFLCIERWISLTARNLVDSPPMETSKKNLR